MDPVKETYLNFLNSDQGVEIYRKFKDILYTKRDILTRDFIDGEIIKKIAENWKGKKEIYICDIGGGDGRRALEVINYIQSKFRIKCHLDLIEPSKSFISRIKDYKIPKNVVVNCINKRFEDVKFSRRYDLVLLIHSIYTFKGNQTIERAISLTNKNGYTVFIGNSPDSFLAGLKKLVDRTYNSERYELYNVEDYLVSKRSLFVKKSFATVCRISKRDYRASVDGVLDFISMGSYQKLDGESRSKILDYIKSKSRRSNDEVVIKEDEVALIIPNVDRRKLEEKMLYELRMNLKSKGIDVLLVNKIGEGSDIAELKNKKIKINKNSRDKLSILFTMAHLYGHLVQFNSSGYYQRLTKRVKPPFPLKFSDGFKQKFKEYEMEAMRIGKGLMLESFDLDYETDIKYYIFMETDFKHYWNYVTTGKKGSIRDFNLLLLANYKKWDKSKRTIDPIFLDGKIFVKKNFSFSVD